jgi:hypothetical protein
MASKGVEGSGPLSKHQASEGVDPSPNARQLMQMNRYQTPGVLDNASRNALHPTHGAIFARVRTLHRLTI